MSEFDIKNMDIVNDIKSTMIGKNKKFLNLEHLMILPQKFSSVINVLSDSLDLTQEMFILLIQKNYLEMKNLM